MLRVADRRALYFTLGVCVWLAMDIELSAADITIAGDRLLIHTGNVRVVMRAGEVVEITNRLTNEVASAGTGRLEPVTAVMRTGGGPRPLRSDGWRRAHEDQANRAAAQTVLRDGVATVWLNVQIDPETEDVVIGAWAESLTEGLKGFRLGVRSLDLTVGRLHVPTQRGFEYTRSDRRESETISYPDEWAAQMIVWQAAQGGVVIYSRDDEARYKKLNLERRGERVDLALETEAEAPWPRQTSVPYLEWRINAYRGDWRVPTPGYRAMMSFFRPRRTPTEAQLWVGQVEAVVEIGPEDGDRLSELANERPPARTLLFLRDWARGRAPEWSLTERAGSLISRAKARGFFVMVPVHVTQADPEWQGFGRVSRYEVRDTNGAPLPRVGGHARMNPASREWRAAVVRGLKEAFAGDAPDALLIVDACDVPNDGNGRIDGRTGAEGMVAMLQDIQRAFPTMVLGSEGMTELVWPYARIARRLIPAERHTETLAAAVFGPTVRWFGP